MGLDAETKQLNMRLLFLGPSVVPFNLFFWEGSPTKIGYRKQGTLILTSLPEDLGLFKLARSKYGDPEISHGLWIVSCTLAIQVNCWTCAIQITNWFGPVFLYHDGDPC